MKIIKKIIVALLVIVMIPIIINTYILIKYNNKITSINDLKETYEYALVLGCSVRKSGEPSLMLEDRLQTAISLYNKGLVKKIIVSGDHKIGYSEVDVMKKYLINNDIDENDIIVDDKGHKTKYSIINYANSYEDKVIIVTQKYHLYRALMLADKNSLEAIGVYAKDVRYVGQFFREIREILARNKDFFLS